MKVKIIAKNITPLAQIESSDKKEKDLTVITIKTLTKIINDIPTDIPIYTANGFRGLLRRIASDIICEEAKKKDIKISTTDFHLMYAGGGNNFQDQPIEIEEKVRELNPVISLFGTSLAVEGKLALTHLEPVNPLIKIKETKDGNVYAESQLIKKIVMITKDEVLDHTPFALKILSKEDVKKWEEFVEKNKKERAKDRASEKDNEDKTKKETIKHIFAKYYLVPNTEMQGYLSNKTGFELTDTEKGLLIEVFKRLGKFPLGSTQNLGFGLMEYDIRFDEEDRISIKRQDNIFLDKVEEDIINDDLVRAKKAFEEFLNNLSEENITISKILVKKK